MQSSHQSQSHFAGLERTSSAQDKAMLQRQYRTKEAHALAQLQKLLRDISRVADTHQTRLATIVQATDMIQFLYCRNNMLQELYELPHPEPGHSATAAFDCHLVQCSLADCQRGNDHVDERQQHSVGPWNPPLTTFPDCPTSLNGIAMSGDRSFRY